LLLGGLSLGPVLGGHHWLARHVEVATVDSRNSLRFLNFITSSESDPGRVRDARIKSGVVNDGEPLKTAIGCLSVPCLRIPLRKPAWIRPRLSANRGAAFRSTSHRGRTHGD
jgi:hypothetical protein